MRFCSQCGSDKLQHSIPEGDNRHRHNCPDCNAIFYENPRIITGCLPYHEDRILLCKRAIEPRKGFWTLPAGFLENGESMAEGALRESREEACAEIELDDIYCLYNLLHIHQVYVFYRGRIRDGRFGVGTESLETRLFREEEIPWDELAFKTVSRTLKHFLADRKTHHYPVRVEDLTWPKPR